MTSYASPLSTPRSIQQSPSTPYSNQSPLRSVYNNSPLSGNPSHSAKLAAGQSPRQTQKSSDIISNRSPISTPKTPHDTPTTPIPTGQWRHPAFDQVNSRLSKKEFTQSTSRKMVLNAVAWAFLSIISRLVSKWSWMLDLASENLKFTKHMKLVAIALQLLFLYNIADGMIRLIRPKDNLQDVPLTPNQRKLMGLDDSVKTLSPSSPITPPRYTKSLPASRETSRPSPLIKRSMQDAIAKKLDAHGVAPSTPQSQRQSGIGSPLSASKPTSSPDKLAQQGQTSGSTTPRSPGSNTFTASGRYLYAMADSPGRSPRR
ncbi:nuclear pore complex component-domain-containing protein [Lipomyces oligophaga]|uniref:nuclear pore complex component-domain-containing protein n=1 Tax=Lipomyces oligophaga TaxID=45792 RepID=UPI0034CDEF8C